VTSFHLLPKVKTRVIELTRFTNTVNGNPRWRIVTTHGVFRTKDDASVNYEISEGSFYGRSVVLYLERGRVVDFKFPCKEHGPHTKFCGDPCVHDGCNDYHEEEGWGDPLG